MIRDILKTETVLLTRWAQAALRFKLGTGAEQQLIDEVFWRLNLMKDTWKTRK